MALINDPSPNATMPKDTTPAVPRTVRYQVLQRTFVNGALVDPATPEGEPNFIWSVAGLEGPALKLAPEKAGAKAGA